LLRYRLAELIQKHADRRERNSNFRPRLKFDPIELREHRVIQPTQLKRYFGTNGVCHKNQGERQQHSSALLAVRLV
jgi:hypothetical protein